jgi:hypothetical protein
MTIFHSKLLVYQTVATNITGGCHPGSPTRPGCTAHGQRTAAGRAGAVDGRHGRQAAPVDAGEGLMGRGLGDWVGIGEKWCHTVMDIA